MIQATLPRQAAPQLDLNLLAKQVMQPWNDAFESWRSGVAELVRPAPASSAHCGCPACRSDPCVCRCCVADADLVIEARVGERRVIPVIVENRWRRERDIELELSSWTQAGGLEIGGRILTPTTLTLAPCGVAHVVLELGIGAPAAAKSKEQGRIADVDRCEVSYADLRIKGCDLRSIRIAVAVLPRDCEAYTVDCDCSCCC